MATRNPGSTNRSAATGTFANLRTVPFGLLLAALAALVATTVVLSKLSGAHRHTSLRV